MLIDENNNKFIFNKNKHFHTRNFKITNNIVTNQILINDEVIYYASVDWIQFSDDEIIFKFTTKDQNEFSYSINKDLEENKLPTYLKVGIMFTESIDVLLKLMAFKCLEQYIKSTNHGFKKEVHLNVPDVVGVPGEEVTIIANIVDSKNNPIPDGNIEIDIEENDN